MSADLPAPPVPSEVDLRDFQYMELDVRRLRDSRFGAEVSGDAFRAGVLLWCASWHQVPAGSLPDDDIELANLAGYGRFVKEWKKSRTQALQGFIKCTDGRLYHEVVCEKAASAWNGKLRHHYDRACDRLRKVNKARATKELAPIPELTFEEWNGQRMAAGLPMEKADAYAGIPQNSAVHAAGIPTENALKGRGNGEGEGEGESLRHSVPDGTGAAAPPPPPEPTAPNPPPAAPAPPADPGPAPSAVDTIFAVGLPMLQQAGVPDRNARTFLGHLRKLAKGRGGDGAVVQALNRCATAQALDPVTFLQACFKAPTEGSDVAGLTERAGRLLGFNTAETIDAT